MKKFRNNLHFCKKCGNFYVTYTEVDTCSICDKKRIKTQKGFMKYMRQIKKLWGGGK